MGIFEAIILGILEGLTEFLPVSSTGHLILASKLMGISQTDVHKSFEVVIQLGSICAVIFVYFEKLFKDFTLMKKLAVAFLPTGILGFVLYKHIKALFAPETVAFMLIFGGVVFIALEYFYKEKEHHAHKIEDISYKQALLIGFAQSFAMVPGTSRSGATIIGGLLSGLNRKTAVEFSFLLAVPTMVIASAYDVLKHYHEMAGGDLSNLAAGFIAAFLVGLLAIKWFLKFVSKFSFVPFGVYRIILGVVFLYILF
ncbi:MAG: undecaprenyl-diphosphate phosphatase [Campylobacterales bacterium]|nr:undecaprenyl-diphosphate phosphatase [Campylobacterales bacterium]